MDHPKIIVVDVDGVLTDGTVYYTQTGERIKGFHSRDIRAMRELVSRGYDVRIITASSWPGMKDFAERCGVDVIVARDKGEVKPAEPYVCIVDDIADRVLIAGAHGAFAPNDCDPELKKKAWQSWVRVLNTAGGRGVISEFVTIIKDIHQWIS